MLNYKTPEELYKIEQANPKVTHNTLEELKKRAKDNRTCIVCGKPVWMYGATELCFSCTTGESDDSDDYELIGE